MNTEEYKSVLGKFLNGRYKIIQVLSVENFGQTYIAEDSWQSGTPQCIVKCFQPQSKSLMHWEICQRRFISDAYALRKLGTHIQIPQFLDSFEDEQGFYLVREFVVGEPLTAELPIAQHSNNVWSEQACIFLLNDVLNLLDAVHRQGIIHGEIKPSNLIRRTCDGKLVLIDFGVAYPMYTTPVTPDVVPITPVITPSNYIATEQLHGQLFPSSDIYALGLIAIQALTGLEPERLKMNCPESKVLNTDWNGSTQNSVASFVPNTRQIDWQEQVTLSDSLACVLNCMVQHDYRSRYQQATDVQTVLKSLMIMSEEQGIITQELSEISDFNSPLGLPNIEDLALCFHDVNRLPQNHLPQLSEFQENHRVSNGKAQSLESRISTKWDYARELAIACIPKLPPILTGMGAGIATSNALVISFGLYSLLNTAPSNPGLDLLERATEQFNAGNLDEAIALAKSIPADSSVYQESVTTVQEWNSEWKQAVTQFQVVERAFQDGRWRDVLDQSHNIPDIAFWQNKIEPLVEQAKLEVETQSQTLLKQAYQQAAKKDFTSAIALLKQIHPETPTGTKIHPKLKEYSHKQKIKAEHLLQKAYQQAAARDFKAALKYLSQIPEETPTYQTAQAKMTEYSRKQDFSEEVERQIRLNAKFSSASNTPIKSSGRSKSSNLNPGNQFKEVAPKPALATPVRR